MLKFDRDNESHHCATHKKDRILSGQLREDDVGYLYQRSTRTITKDVRLASKDMHETSFT